MFGLGPMEIMLIAGVGLLLFGKRLPDVARGMGRSVVEFKRGLKEIESDAEATASKEQASADKKRPAESTTTPTP